MAAAPRRTVADIRVYSVRVRFPAAPFAMMRIYLEERERTRNQRLPVSSPLRRRLKGVGSALTQVYDSQTYRHRQREGLPLGRPRLRRLPRRPARRLAEGERPMATLTIRLPDAQRDRLAAMAARRGVSLNKLMQELAVRALAEHDTEMRFRVRARPGRRGAGARSSRRARPAARAGRGSLRPLRLGAAAGREISPLHAFGAAVEITGGGRPRPTHPHPYPRSSRRSNNDRMSRRPSATTST